MIATMTKTVTFQTLGGRRLKAKVKNGSATVGALASRAAARAGLAGSFELLDDRGATLDPNTRLDALADDQTLTMVSELTPAC
ncbi:MAG: hypothetical protein KatS3mg109_0290 [Pirellulaceae bacterium]|nr:MAG: hypothetical protein KatS3mg109_0290 [Pirellulaceae bacterium]